MQKIAVYFECPEISYLFSSIASIHGAEPVITDNFSDCDRVITEAKFYEELPLILRGSNCLLVGEKKTNLPHIALSLTRPLNQNKIEKALNRLLS